MNSFVVTDISISGYVGLHEGAYAALRALVIRE
jgi:hypothetical protein